MTTGNLVVTPGGNMVVAEGTSRARWRRRIDGSWKLVGIWPDEDELVLVRRRLRDGVGLLIVLDPVPSILHAFRDELDDPRLLAAAAPEESIIDVAVPFLDWLPESYHERARRFQSKAREQTADRPAALQPALLLEDLLEPGEAVLFAARAARSVQGAISPEQLCAVADYAFSTTPGRRDSDPEPTGDTGLFDRRTSTITTGPRPATASASGGGHGH